MVNSMKTGNEFGCTYGDYGGVAFHGPHENGLDFDVLEIAGRFRDPLFNTILKRHWEGIVAGPAPRLVMDWNSCTGWCDEEGEVPLAPADATALIDSLALLTAEDVQAECHGCTADECIRCAGLICACIRERLANGSALRIEDF